MVAQTQVNDFKCTIRTKFIYFGYKHLKSFPKCPKSMPNLERIRLQGNNLRKIPVLPVKLPALREFSLGNNQLTRLKGLPQSMPRLQVLDLRNNLLHNLNFFPKTLPKLEHLILAGNPLRSFEGLPESLPNLQEIHLWNVSRVDPSQIIHSSLKSLFGVSRTLLPLVVHSIVKALYFRVEFSFLADALDLIRACNRRTFWNYENFDQNMREEDSEQYDLLFNYFRESPLELAQRYVKEGGLSPNLENRLIHESDYKVHQYFESNLDPHSKILGRLEHQRSFALQTGFQLFI